MMRAAIAGVGIVGPGLLGWALARPVLAGARPFEPVPLPKLAPERMPPRERRRATKSIALALSAAEQAVSGRDRAGGIPAVFASSGGDTDVIDSICNALLQPGRPVSPGQFHNSVHNAPAGYWSIAVGGQAPTTSLSAYDGSFAAGLLEAVTTLHGGAREVLLVAYDVLAPPAIYPFRPLEAPFALALLLAAERADGQPLWDIALASDQPEESLDDPALERLRVGNPAARGLPLLRALALGRAARVVVPYLPGRQLVVEHTP
jgi:hypothetical protein